MYYKAVIFDLDGTLLDTIGDIVDSMNAVLTDLGCPKHSVDAYKGFIGDGLDVLVRRSLPETMRDERTVRTCVQAMRKEYGQRWARTSRPFKNIPELLDGLMAMDMKISVFSNKLDVFTKEMVSVLLGAWQFHTVLGLNDAIPRKPDPSGALAIARAMHMDPGQCIFVGDSNIDMETAQRAGMRPVGVLWGYQDRNRLISGGAKDLLSDPLDLLPILEG
ncbi:MAG TPA: HAD family hydrolase [Deltaproteobacteria bacterium]|nr:HAD family hydrolase [Deltaproteobacteria bacterium]HPJ92696.1 HAD family hydrolase [Deltaproteobacteria bacterium]HPR50533.1 HAD family hydrolase [Deltaproteobacteria bacterium]